jgi:hypothetical protein
VTAPRVDVDGPVPFAPARRRSWLSPALLGLLTFAIASLAIRSAAERQAPILDSMEIQPFAAAASLAYAWGSTDDAVTLEHEVLALAERAHAGETPSKPVAGEVNFDALRRMDADTAKFRLAVLEAAPLSKFAELCAASTIRCTPYTLDGLVNMFKKQRLVHDAH